LREYLAMWRLVRAAPIEFFRYRLWDASVPRTVRRQFITWHLRQQLEPFLNSRVDSQQFTSKIKTDDFFRVRELATPRRLGVWCPLGVSSDASDAISIPGDLAGVIQRARGNVVIKSDYGMMGNAVLVFVATTDDTFVAASGDTWTLDRLVHRMQGTESWLIQERVMAHPELAALAGSEMVSSVRMTTCLRDDGQIFLLPTTLKLPATKNGLDNFGGGNVGISVGPDGILGTGVYGKDGPVVESHPVSGIRFVGRQVPHWDAAVKLVHLAQGGLGTMRSLGWDVAITPDGPMLLEGNPYWGVDVLQQPGRRGLLQGEFRDFVIARGAAAAMRMTID
jgi:hypothetical protein